MKKSSLLAFFSMFIVSCNCGQEPLTEVYGLPCYTNEHKELVILEEEDEQYKKYNTGACSTGVTEKIKEETVCVGQIQPTEETCNGIDDNCNGYTDEDNTGYTISIPHYSNKNTCSDIGVCMFSRQTCIEGQLVCEYPSRYGKESCDGLDNDCDGLTDEDLPEEPLYSPEERFVYTGEPSTLNVGECRAGYKECINGLEYVRNMTTPIPEICGNDDDDDCDGMTDEIETQQQLTDFVFIIDYSGSMNGYIYSVANALCSWSSQGILSNSRFAVVAIGYLFDLNDNSEYALKQLALLTDFTDAGTACQVIRDNNIDSNYGAIELQTDAAYYITEPETPITVSWQNTDKRIIIFTDEAIQQSFRDDIEQAVSSVIDKCYEQHHIIGAFINQTEQDQHYWYEIAENCNGFIDYLQPNPYDMVETLNYWVGSACSDI